MALTLNLLFRIGTSKSASLVLPTDPDAIEEVRSFTEDEGGRWGARNDVIYRVTGALTEFMEAASELELVEDEVSIDLSFDESISFYPSITDPNGPILPTLPGSACQSRESSQPRYSTIAISSSSL